MVIQLLDKTLYGIIMVGKGSLFGVLYAYVKMYS